MNPFFCLSALFIFIPRLCPNFPSILPSLSPPHTQTRKMSRRGLLLCCACLVSWQIFQSGKKLAQNRVTVTVERAYPAKQRLPLISICPLSQELGKDRGKIGKDLGQMYEESIARLNGFVIHAGQSSGP